MKNIIFTILTLFFLQSVYAQSISVTGQWNYTIPTTDITEAGEDFTGTYSSNVNQVYLDIDYNSDWTVSVQKNDIDWDDELEIAIHRTGNGYGTGDIKQGKNYKKIQDRSRNFFRGSGARYNIPLQFQIRKVSVTIPAHNYMTEIMYTLTNK